MPVQNLQTLQSDSMVSEAVKELNLYKQIKNISSYEEAKTFLIDHEASNSMINQLMKDWDCWQNIKKIHCL